LDPKVLIDSAAVLKNIPRTGWLQRGVPPAVAETVAEHSFDVASILSVIAMVSEDHIAGEKLLLMGTIHDWGEAVAGDIPKSLTLRLKEDSKSRIERSIMDGLSSASGVGKLTKVFQEYEERTSDEALVAKIADVLSTQRQAACYIRRGYPVQDIFDGCKEELEGLIPRVRDERIREVIRILL
jgi:putative hydrolase of HD superfamily